MSFGRSQGVACGFCESMVVRDAGHRRESGTWGTEKVVPHVRYVCRCLRGRRRSGSGLVEV